MQIAEFVIKITENRLRNTCPSFAEKNRFYKGLIVTALKKSIAKIMSITKSIGCQPYLLLNRFERNLMEAAMKSPRRVTHAYTRLVLTEGDDYAISV